MRWIRPDARFVLVVIALAVLAGRPVAAGPPEPRTAGVADAHVAFEGAAAGPPEPRTAVVVEADVANEGDEDSRARQSRGEPRRARRPLRGPIRNPWSVGVRALWRSFRVSTGGGGDSFRASCRMGAACSPSDLRSQVGKPIGPVTGDRHPVEGVALYAGRLITTGAEVGAGLDLTTHPVLGTQSFASLVTPGGGLGELSAGEHAAQVLSGDRALQIDLAGRLTYRFGNHDGPAPTRPVGNPYLGFGGGVSRYFPGASDYTTLGFVANAQPSAGLFDQTLFDAWTPNLQLYGGFTVRFPDVAPMLDLDFRYVRARFHGLDLGGFRMGTGIRFAF